MEGMQMRELDKVIGYEHVKRELYRIIDMFHNPEKYRALGVKIPKGVVLSGEPGIGKTLMAKSFMKESGRKEFIIRKDRPDGDFVEHIRKTFDEAAENAPAILLLDDMDKFANDDRYHRNSEEYVTVQTCIDAIKDKDVFVIATCNDTDNLPGSLLRSGRFDKSFEMEFPKGEDAEKIISFYLEGKMVSDDIDVKEIARFCEGHSCADLETIVNEAGIYAGYDNRERMDQNDLKRSCLRMIYHTPEETVPVDEKLLRLRAVHEAGHAVLAEVEDIMRLHHDSRRLGAGAVFRSLNSTVSMALASIFGIGGISLTVSAACAGGGHAVGLALSLIRSGQVDACIVLGAQEVGLHAYTSFDALGIFSQRADDPEKASRPFDAARDGLVPSGGAACVILESAEHAAMGNRKPMATVRGYGFCTSPDIVTPSAESIFRCMSNAIQDADINPEQLSMIMAHATSTQDGDRAEADALLSLSLWLPKYTCGVGKPIGNPFVVSTKCLTGHECWMSGVSQVVYALIQMQGGFVAPHINLEQPEPAAARLNIPTKPTVTNINYVLCNAFGFGGTNSSIIISKP